MIFDDMNKRKYIMIRWKLKHRLRGHKNPQKGIQYILYFVLLR